MIVLAYILVVTCAEEKGKIHVLEDHAGVYKISGSIKQYFPDISSKTINGKRIGAKIFKPQSQIEEKITLKLIIEEKLTLMKQKQKKLLDIYAKRIRDLDSFREDYIEARDVFNVLSESLKD